MDVGGARDTRRLPLPLPRQGVHKVCLIRLEQEKYLGADPILTSSIIPGCEHVHMELMVAMDCLV